MFAWLLFLFCMVVAYLIGSVCSAVIVCKLFDLPDPRMEGSKNPGATNVLRIAGQKYALMVLFADMVKGIIPVVLAKFLGLSPAMVGFVCLGAVLGHIYPLYFDFKGGKGVATAFGALLGFHFILGVLVLAVWLLVAHFTRYVSLASIISIILAPFFSLYAVRGPDAFLPLVIITFFILYRHKDNMTRLMDGTEDKLNLSSRHKHAAEAPAPTSVAPKARVSQPKKSAKKTTQKTVSAAKEKKSAAKKVSSKSKKS